MAIQNRLPGIDFDNEGAESEEDIRKIDTAEIERVHLWPTDWTVETIIRQVERKNIALDPAFQRRDVWRVERKSRFIESLIVNLPIPQIVLAEDPKDKSKFIVVDGKQRLLSILQFFGRGGWSPFELKGLTLLDYNGLGISGLPPTDRDVLENRSIRCIIIKGHPSNELLNVVFHRLNSNTIALSSQELRQSLHAGPFTDFADKYTREEHYLSCLFGEDGPDFRMRDIELVIRYLAFKQNLVKYSGNLKQFLDDATKSLNDNWSSSQSKVLQQIAQLKDAVETTEEILGENAFRKFVVSDKRYEYRFNRSIFDLFVYYLSEKRTADALLANKEAFVSAYERLFEDRDFIKAVETTTKSKSAVKNRFLKFGELVKRFDNALVLPAI